MCPPLHAVSPQATSLGLLGTYCVLPSLSHRAEASGYRRYSLILKDLIIYWRKQILYPYFHPVFLWFANDVTFLSRGEGVCGREQSRLPVRFKG